MDSLPNKSEDLIQLLDSRYPERTPSLKDSDREVWWKAGRRALIDDLLNQVRQQKDPHPDVQSTESTQD